MWLSQLADPLIAPAGSPVGRASAALPPAGNLLADKAEVLRWYIRWLAQLEQEAHVVVHLRPASEEATTYVPFDRPRMVWVLTRIAVDLDALARCTLARAAEEEDRQDAQRARHRQRLAEPKPPPRRRSRWEGRAASRQMLGLLPYERS